MIKQITLANLPATINLNLPATGNIFTMRTCQRYLLLAYKDWEKVVRHNVTYITDNKLCLPNEIEFYRGPEAYQYLLEVVCGLRSRLLGETEIAGQFRKAYQEFTESPQMDCRLLFILEKILKDSKEIRSKYLSQIGQQSYASLTRFILNQRVRNQAVLLLGSGELALDLVKLLKKRFVIHISARDAKKVGEWGQQFALVNVPWNLDSFWQFPAIVNTIGADNTILFDKYFFNKWMQNVLGNNIFIDLGVPSVVRTNLSKQHGIYRTDDLYEIGIIKDKEKQRKISHTMQKIKELTMNRERQMTSNYGLKN